MPRTTESATISLPRADYRQLERARKRAHCSRSQVVREALPEYFAMRRPAEEITDAECADMHRGREEIARGEYVTLDELNEILANPDAKARSKATRKTARR